MLALLALIAPATAHAQTQAVSEGPDKVSIVVYPQLGNYGLVMITEQRTIDLPAGPVKIVLRNVAEQIVPQTVSLHGLPQEVAEQNYDYQLLTPGSLIRASEGRMVGFGRTDAATGREALTRGRIVSGTHGAVIDIDGRLEGFKCSGALERLVFDDLPYGFVAKPSLSVLTVVPTARRATLSLSYLATGVSWRANYVAKVAADGKTLDLTSWITIANTSSTRFDDVPVQVMAGRLEQRPAETRPPVIPPDDFDPECWPVNKGRFVPRPPPLPPLFLSSDDLLKMGSPSMDQLIRNLSEAGLNESGGAVSAGYGVRTINLRNLGAGRTLVLFDGVRTGDPQTNGGAVGGAVSFVSGPALAQAEILADRFADYTLYALPERTTLAAYQTKQLFLFERKGVTLERVYRQDRQPGLVADEEPEAIQPARALLRMKNETAAGLGLSLPAGKVSVFEPGGGTQMLVGQPELDNTAWALPVELELDPSTLVQTRTTVRDFGDPADASVTIDIEVTNAGDRSATVELTERKLDIKVVKENARHIETGETYMWRVSVPAHGKRVLSYTLALDR